MKSSPILRSELKPGRANGGRPPISLPHTPDSHIVFPIEILNHDLDVWGFTHDTEAFRKTIRYEHDLACSTPEKAAVWADERSAWADRGKEILVRLETFPFEGLLEMFCPPAYFEVWSRLRRAAFQIMYMLAIVEFYLDT